jgi:exopolyphosphatase/pppGpp-phosphohydrolase
MDVKRADVIVAGALCLSGACAAIGAERFEVSIRGIRYGIALQMSMGGFA